jgi:hypothetical protein
MRQGTTETTIEQRVQKPAFAYSGGIFGTFRTTVDGIVAAASLGLACYLRNGRATGAEQRNLEGSPKFPAT